MTSSKIQKRKVFVRADLTSSSLRKLREVSEFELNASIGYEELLQIIGEYHGIICSGPEKLYDEKFFEAAKRLIILARVSVGVDTVNLQAAAIRGVYVTNTAGANASSVAEQAFCLILALSRKILECDKVVRSGKDFRDKDVYAQLRGIEIEKKTLGLVGFGSVGREVAKRGLCFGMRVLACDPYIEEKNVNYGGVLRGNLEKILNEADFIVLCCPLTEETRGIICRNTIRMMKKSAYIVNVARGSIIVEKDLVEALKDGAITGAGLDVTASEPLSAESALLTCEKVVFGAHQGGNTADVWERACNMAVLNVISVMCGEEPSNRVLMGGAGEGSTM